MKKYTDQGKVDTRSGFGAGACILLALALCVGSCRRFPSDDRYYAILEYSYNGMHEVFFPENRIQDILFPRTEIYWPEFYSGPLWGDSSEIKDSLAWFSFSISRDRVEIGFEIRSDTTFFVAGKKYYLSKCDSIDFWGVKEPYELHVFFPGLSDPELIRNSSWLSFLLTENSDIWFSIDFEYAFSEHKDAADYRVVGETVIDGHLDIYRTAYRKGQLFLLHQ